MPFKVLSRRVSSHDDSFEERRAALRTVGRLAAQLTEVGVYPSGALGRARCTTARSTVRSEPAVAPIAVEGLEWWVLDRDARPRKRLPPTGQQPSQNHSDRGGLHHGDV